MRPDEANYNATVTSTPTSYTQSMSRNAVIAELLSYYLTNLITKKLKERYTSQKAQPETCNNNSTRKPPKSIYALNNVKINKIVYGPSVNACSCSRLLIFNNIKTKLRSSISSTSTFILYYENTNMELLIFCEKIQYSIINTM